ncbi:hypothetical protein PG996_006645 [Apiospora saccharicola]|uniref:Uncharacterized protein n=1 Tax=Apiospora saccharicola TaxID=335842 RepID=A0ABR1VC73_9PEZI
MAYNALSTSLPPDSRHMDEVTVTDQTSSYSPVNMHSTKGTMSTMSQAPVAEIPLSSAGDPPRQESTLEKQGRPSAKKPDRTQYRVFTHFQWEILSILLSLGIIVAMYVLLIEYNNKLVSDWRFPINLTTLLALMSTIMRAALFVPITSIISQAKWQLFGGDRPRPLQDLQDIDMGSRGMIGAINIVPLAARASIPTLVAVLLSIVSLGIGPFVQQALRTVPCDQIVPGQAMVPYTHFVTSKRFVVPNTAFAQSDIQAMMYNTLAMPDDQGNEIRFQCPTGNCTFNNGSPAWSHQRPGGGPQRNGSSVFSTMAMCHKCLDMSDFVNLTDEVVVSDTVSTLTPTLPNGLSMQLGGAPMIGMGRPTKFTSMTGNVTWAKFKLDEEMLHIASMSLGNVTILTHNNEKNDLDQTRSERRKSVVASTCFLYACTRTFNVSIANGELSEELIDTAPANSGPVQVADVMTKPTADYVVKMSPCWVGDHEYTLTNEPDRDSDRLGDVWSCSRNGNQVPAEKCGGTPDTQQCYYHHEQKHAIGMMGAFRKSFNIKCINFNDAITCYDDNEYQSGSSAQGDSGQGTWAESLYAANVTTQKIDDMFARFATIVSNRYRMTFGSSQPHFIESMTEPPWGQVRGTVQHTAQCNAVRLDWLAFPTAIMALTLVILLWTMLTSWLDRKDRPVWKDSILPFLLYSHRFKREGGDSGSGTPVVVGENRDTYGVGYSSSSSAHDNKTLLETGEMEDIARDMHVRIEWPKTGKRRDVEVDSLMHE